MCCNYLVFAAMLVLVTKSLCAHRIPESLTTIERNENTGTFEIIHRFHLHDAEKALGDDSSQPPIESLEGRAYFALYVESKFTIEDMATRETLKLKLIGAELDGSSILVYQELEAPLPPALKIKNETLRDHFPKQVNTVNITYQKQVYTLMFQGNEIWKALILKN